MSSVNQIFTQAVQAVDHQSVKKINFSRNKLLPSFMYKYDLNQQEHKHIENNIFLKYISRVKNEHETLLLFFSFIIRLNLIDSFCIVSRESAEEACTTISSNIPVIENFINYYYC